MAASAAAAVEKHAKATAATSGKSHKAVAKPPAATITPAPGTVSGNYERVCLVTSATL